MLQSGSAERGVDSAPSGDLTVFGAEIVPAILCYLSVGTALYRAWTYSRSGLWLRPACNNWRGIGERVVDEMIVQRMELPAVLVVRVALDKIARLKTSATSTSTI